MTDVDNDTKTFDERIPREAACARMRRDGIPGDPVCVLVRRKSHAGREYLVRRTGAVLPDGRVVDYRLRRDGKVSGGYPHAVDGHAIAVEANPEGPGG